MGIASRQASRGSRSKSNDAVRGPTKSEYW